MVILSADHDLSPESARMAAALCGATVPTTGVRFGEEALARFALGLCDDTEKLEALRALIASPVLRERLLAMQTECQPSAAARRSAAVAAALGKAVAAASAVYAGNVGRRPGSDGPFRRGLAAIVRTVRAERIGSVAFVRGSEFQRSLFPGLERNLALELDGDDLVASARFRDRALELEGTTLTLALADPAGGQVPLVSESVRDGRWEARVEGFGSASGLHDDELTGDLFRLVGVSAADPSEEVRRLPVAVRDHGEADLSDEADIRSHGPVRFLDEKITITLSASRSTRDRFAASRLHLALPLGTLDLSLGIWKLSEWDDRPRTLSVPLPGAADGTVVCGSFLLAELLPEEN